MLSVADRPLKNQYFCAPIRAVATFTPSHSRFRSAKKGFRAVKEGFDALQILAHFQHNRKDIFHYVLFSHALATFDPNTGLPLTGGPVG